MKPCQRWQKKKHPYGSGKEGTKKEEQHSTRRQHPSTQKTHIGVATKW